MSPALGRPSLAGEAGALDAIRSGSLYNRPEP